MFLKANVRVVKNNYYIKDSYKENESTHEFEHFSQDRSKIPHTLSSPNPTREISRRMMLFRDIKSFFQQTTTTFPVEFQK